MTEKYSVKYGISGIDDVETRISNREVLSEEKFQALINASADAREKYFFNQVALKQEVWMLFDDEIFPIYNGEQTELINVWPDKEFAEECHMPSVVSPRAVPIPIDDFLDEILQPEPLIELSIFPVGVNSPTKVGSIDYFATTISNEIARYQKNPAFKY